MTDTTESRGSAEAKAWAQSRTQLTGAAIAKARRAQGLSAQQLAAKTAELGYPVTRGAIAKFESGLRGSIDAYEVEVLAEALGVPAAALLYPGQASSPVVRSNGSECDVATATAALVSGRVGRARLAYADLAAAEVADPVERVLIDRRLQELDEDSKDAL